MRPRPTGARGTPSRARPARTAASATTTTTVTVPRSARDDAGDGGGREAADQRGVLVLGSRPRLPAAPDRQRAGHPARHARAGAGAALGRRQGQPVLPARLRRRPRHRSGAVDRRHPDQHGVARPRPGLRRHQLHHPRGGRARRDHQGPLLRAPGRLRDRRRGQHGVARRLRAQLRRRRASSARPGTARRAIAAWLIASPRFEDDASRRRSPPRSARTNGPFDNPERWDRYKLFNKLTFAPTPTLDADPRRR